MPSPGASTQVPWEKESQVEDTGSLGQWNTTEDVLSMQVTFGQRAEGHRTANHADIWGKSPPSGRSIPEAGVQETVRGWPVRQEVRGEEQPQVGSQRPLQVNGVAIQRTLEHLSLFLHQWNWTCIPSQVYAGPWLLQPHFILTTKFWRGCSVADKSRRTSLNRQRE